VVGSNVGHTLASAVYYIRRLAVQRLSRDTTTI
jgi:hypothetical protein